MKPGNAAKMGKGRCEECRKRRVLYRPGLDEEVEISRFLCQGMALMLEGFCAECLITIRAKMEKR